MNTGLLLLMAIIVVTFIIFGHIFAGCRYHSGQDCLFNDLLDWTSNVIRSMRIGEPQPHNNDIVYSKVSHKEAFTSFNENSNTKSWGNPDLTYSKGKEPSQGVQNILNRPEQPIPLPKGEMLLFADTEFKPECCPNTYSTGSGCACMTVAQYNYLIDRGGNNVPYSEY